jgi:ABC-type Fe3+ transport system substrate-binding protein
MGILKREGIFQEYFSPEARFYPNDLKPKGKNGFFYLPNRETYNSLGFNTKLVPPATAPRTLKDLLDPRWKGKMTITSTSTGVRWIGNALETQGREYLDKMAEQEVGVQDMAPAALINLVGSGEVPLSPTIFDANVTIAKQKGSPVEWRPLEPVVTTVGSAALTAESGQSAYRAPLHRPPSVKRRPATDHEGWPLVAARGCRLHRAKVQEKLSG